MGSVVRGCRNERYMKEFGVDIVEKLPFTPGDVLKVTGVYLADIDGDERVWSVVEVQDAKGELHTFQLACIFDPEDDGEEDSIERLSSYDIDEDEARRRLKRAKLF